MSCRCAHPSADIYLPQPATVRATRPLTALERHFEICLDSGCPLGHQAGQFVQVYVPGAGEIPISVSSSPERADAFELVVRRVGRVTEVLHRLDAGARLGIRGPYGTAFPVADTLKDRDLVFICGGIGLVPVRSAIQYTLAHRADYGRVTILYGTKGPADRLFADELAAWADRPDITFRETVDRADPAWRGHVGVITTLIPGTSMDPRRCSVIVCGPPVMYKFVLIELFAKQLPADQIYLSFERHMKCGVGKCGHCQINGYYTCTDGPVFRYSDVAGTQEAI